MQMKTCNTCGAHWVNDQLYWSNGKTGKDLDLAGLVCNRLNQEKPCINPCKGMTGGDTWEKRQAIVDRIIEEL